jgi:HAD superfamily hydrolase (TIGR01549 family)
MHNNKTDIKGILFDLDGTILDTKSAYIEAGKIAFEAINVDVPEEEKLLEIPKRIEQKKSFEDLVKRYRREFLKSYLNTFYRISASKTKPLPGAEETLEILSRNFRLAVITMRFMTGKEIVNELRQFKLDKYFVHVVTALDTSKPKPSPESLIRAVSAIDVDMCECVIVGDSIVDIQAGKAAGIQTIAVLSGLYTYEELVRFEPTCIVKELSELPELINGSLSR